MLTDFFCAPWAGKPIIIDLPLCEHNWHELQLTLSFMVAGQTITALPFGVSVFFVWVIGKVTATGNPVSKHLSAWIKLLAEIFTVKPAELAEKMGMSAESLRIKLRRAAFSAGFFLQALDALEVKKVNLEEIKRLEKDSGVFWPEITFYFSQKL